MALPSFLFLKVERTMEIRFEVYCGDEVKPGDESARIRGNILRGRPVGAEDGGVQPIKIRHPPGPKTPQKASTPNVNHQESHHPRIFPRPIVHSSRWDILSGEFHVPILPLYSNSCVHRSSHLETNW